MGVEVNKHNFLGTMLPNVKITKITLNNSTGGAGYTGKADGYVSTGYQLVIEAEIYEQIDNNGDLSYLSSSGFEKYISFRAVAICGEHSAISPGVAYEPIKQLMAAEITDTSALRNNIPILKQGGYPTNSVNLYEILERILKKYPEFDANMVKYAKQAEEDDITPFAIKVGALSSQYMLQLIKKMPSFQAPGGTTYALPIEISIELNPIEYDNKAVIVFSEFDFDSFLEDWPKFGKMTDMGNIPTFYGTPSLHVLKIDGQQQYTKPAFFDNAGNPWFGGVTSAAEGNNIVTYAEKLTTPPTVITVENVPSNIYVDNTVFNKIDKLNINYDFLENEFINSSNLHNNPYPVNIGGVHNAMIAKDVINSLSLNAKPSIFSDIYMARSTAGTNGAAVGLFTVDLKQVFANHASFAMPFKNKYITNPNKYMSDIINRSKLKRLKVYREKVNHNTRDKNHKKDLIIDVDVEVLKTPNLLTDVWAYGVNHNNPLEKNKLPKDYSIYSGVESNTPQIEKIKLNSENNTNFLMHFNIYDPTVPDEASSLSLTGLQYAYSVEIDIEDGSSDFVLMRYKKLNQVSKYLGHMLKVTTVVNRYDPDLGYYNEDTDSFTKKFNGLPPAALDDYVGAYVETLNIFTSAAGGSSVAGIEGMDSLKNKIINMTNHLTATRDSVTLFKNKVDNLLNQLIKFTNTKKSSRLSGFDSFKDPATDMKNASLKDITISTTFDSTFDASMLKNTGYEYIQLGTVDNPPAALPWRGLLKISSKNYNIRIANETLKYFKEQEHTVSITMSQAQVSAKTYNFGSTGAEGSKYFSPSFVRLQDTIYPLLSIPDGILNPEKKNLTQQLVLDILSTNETNFKKHTNKEVSQKNKGSEKEIKKQVMLQDLLTKYGVTIGSGDNIAGSEIDLDKVDSSIYNKYEVLTTELEGMDAPPEKYQALQEAQTNVINETVNRASTFMLSFVSNNIFQNLPLHGKGLEVFNLHFPENLIEQIINVEETLPEIPDGPVSEWMISLPNQIKALFASGAPQSPTRFNFFNSEKGKFNIYGGDDIGKFYFHFQNLVEVQYLAGYQSIKNDASSPCVKKPVWKGLGSFDVPDTGMVLCRLKPYRDRNIINDKVKELELPIYNQYFLLGNDI